MFSFQIEDGSLVIKEIMTEKVVWQGKPFNCEVSKIIPFSSTECLVLLDYYEFSLTENRSKGNLFLMNVNGEIIWHAQTPSSDDSYVHFNVIDNKISANSWNGFHVQIEPATGKIIHQEFTR